MRIHEADLISEQAQPIVKYQRLHDSVVEKIKGLLEEKLAGGEADEEGWCKNRVDTLKKYWTQRLNAYKKDVKVWLKKCYCS